MFLYSPHHGILHLRPTSYCLASFVGAMALEALGVASSVIAVIEISGRVAAICFQYSKGVKNAKFEVNRLLREVNNLGETTSSVQDLLDGPCGNRLKTSSKLLDAIEEARAHLSKLMTI